MLQLTFNHGLTLTGFRTTQPRRISRINEVVDLAVVVVVVVVVVVNSRKIDNAYPATSGRNVFSNDHMSDQIYCATDRQILSR